MIKNRFDAPFDKFPREGSLPILNKYHVKNRVGEHFEKLLRSEQVEHLIDTQLMSMHEEYSPRDIDELDMT